MQQGPNINIIFNKLIQAIGKPTTELHYSTNFELLIAVMLSARTTDVSVNKATKELFKVANTPEQIIRLGLTGLKKHIKSLGFYNTKATNIIKTCTILVNKFNGQIPQTGEELESLPGVGRKTANVVLNVAFNQPTIAVDTHVERVAKRIGLAKGKTPLEIEIELKQNIPKKFHHLVSNLLILHGRYTCKAKKPLCSICVINDICEKNGVAQF